MTGIETPISPATWTRPGWFDDAACKGMGPEIFFPPSGTTAREAKAICRSCPVREQCGQSALSANERFGVWGGRSENDRRAQRRAPRWRATKSTRPFPSEPILANFDGVRPAEISRLLDVRISTVAKWRQGGGMYRSTAVKVCNRLGVDPATVWDTW